MRITCPKCAAQYEVDAGHISEDGRDVQCSACGHTWMQFGDGRVEEIPEEDVPNAAAEEPEPEADETDSEDEIDVARVPRRELDPDARRILREEAQREAARRRTRRVTGAETQPDPEIEEQAAPVAEEPAAPIVTATQAPGAQRLRRPGSGMFPDIEEINSTLSSGDEADRDHVEPASGSDAFRSGFLLMLALAILIMALYLAAPWIATRVPALESAMAAYVGGINDFRVAVEGLLQSAAEWIDGLSG